MFRYLVVLGGGIVQRQPPGLQARTTFCKQSSCLSFCPSGETKMRGQQTCPKRPKVSPRTCCSKQASPPSGWTKVTVAAPLLTVRNDRKIGCPKSFNFNVFNLREQSAGCFRETKKDLRKTIRHLEKTTKHLEKIIRQVVAPSSGLFFGKSGQKETEEALYLREVLGIAMQIYNIFQRKANRQNCILTFREQCRP